MSPQPSNKLQQKRKLETVKLIANLDDKLIRHQPKAKAYHVTSFWPILFGSLAVQNNFENLNCYK